MTKPYHLRRAGVFKVLSCLNVLKIIFKITLQIILVFSKQQLAGWFLGLSSHPLALLKRTSGDPTSNIFPFSKISNIDNCYLVCCSAKPFRGIFPLPSDFINARFYFQRLMCVERPMMFKHCGFIAFDFKIASKLIHGSI